MTQVLQKTANESFLETFKVRECCPLCDETERHQHYHRIIREIPLTFSRCKGCDLIYQDPHPSSTGLLEYFSSNMFIKDDVFTDDLTETLGYYDYEAWDACYRKTAQIRLQHIMDRAAPPGKLLEIGTATGSFVNEARKMGYEVRGLDVSATFAQNARARYKVDIQQGFIEEAELPENEYDVVCAFGGIACWYDPLKAMQQIQRTLKPGGVFVFNYSHFDNPLGRLSGDSYPEYNHASLLIYTRPTMRILLERAGWDVLEDHTEWQYASLERIVTYWRSNFLRKVVDAVGLSGITLKVPAIGTRLAVCRQRHSS